MIPGQCCFMLHGILFVELPSQSPSGLYSWVLLSMQFLVMSCVPFPQVLLHELEAVHPLQDASKKGLQRFQYSQSSPFLKQPINR